jgi:hypothetical protein
VNEKRPIRAGLTAVLFLLALAGGTLFWLWGARDDLGALTWETVKTLPAQGEEIVNDCLDRDHTFIQLYGGVQRLLGRRVLRDVDETYTVYQLSDGALTFVNPAPADCLEDNAAAYLAFQDALEARGIPLLYLQAPQKIDESGAGLPAGVTDYGNANADGFLELLRQGGGSLLDLRQVLTQDGQPWTSYFYATDHHWKPETALLCAGAVAEYLNEQGGLDLDASLLDPDRYTAQTYDDLFLGSQGKRVGTLYAGLDDFTVWTPKFATDFTYTTPYEVRQGTFQDALLFPERLEETDPFQANPYTLYAGGDYASACITNRADSSGPRVLLLRDSFGCAFTPFFALACSQLTTVDLRYFDGDLLSLVDETAPDYVLVLYSPGALKTTAAFPLAQFGIGNS